MELEYKNLKGAYVFIGIIFILIALLIASGAFKNSIWYYELFNPSIFLSIGVYVGAFIPLFKPKISLQQEGIVVQNSKPIEISYKNILGISMGIDSIDIITKDKLRFSIMYLGLNNLREVKSFLINDKNLSKLPIYYSFSLRNVLWSIYFVLCLVSISLLFSGKMGVLKEYLTNKKVEVVLLEGTTENSILAIYGNGVKNVNTMLRLTEYPGLDFKYTDSNRLKDIIHETKKGFVNIPEKSIVKIKIRKSDFDKLQNENKNEPISFYSLEFNGEIIQEKKHLELVDK